MYRGIIFLLVTISTTSSAHSLYTDAMYREAILKESTAPLYVLFTLGDAKTGSKRVVCTTANFLLGAIHVEYHLDYDDTGLKRGYAIALRQPGHCFSFANRKALENIAGGDTPEMIAKIRQQFGALSDAQLRKAVENNQFDDWCQAHQPRGKFENCQAAAAHLLLERGILVGQGDWAPNLYIER